jgi:hypothetical protein
MTAYATANNKPFSAAVLTPDELNRVTGGTFTKNKYSKSTYHSFGISTSYNFFDEDEFMFMGRTISYQQANEIVALGDRVYNVLNEGNNGANMIGYGEPAFIRAFNSQLKLKYGIQWNGAPGSDY